MSEKILVPALGESVTEATVSKWLKSVGEEVDSDEPLVELETDKVNVEVPSPSSGVLDKIAVQEGSTVQVGAFLGAYLGGYFFTNTGSYEIVWIIDILLAVFAAIVHLPIKEKRVNFQMA